MKELLYSAYSAWPLIEIVGIITGLMSFHMGGDDSSSKSKATNDHLGKPAVKIIKLGMKIITILALFCGPIYYFSTEVPQMKGTAYSSAEVIADNHDLSIELGANQIREQDSVIVWHYPSAGEIVRKGSIVTVYLNENIPNTEVPSSSSIPEITVVPNVVGMEQIAGTQLLQSYHLNFQVWWTAEHNISSEEYYIIGQSVQAGTEVDSGTVIKLELSPYKPE